MQQKKYKIKYTYSSRNDIRKMKKYILDHFKYQELGENFMRKMKEAANGLKMLPRSQATIDFLYNGYDIYLKPYHTYLFFYIVDEEDAVVTVLRVLQEGMNWKFIIKQWLAQTN